MSINHKYRIKKVFNGYDSIYYLERKIFFFWVNVLMFRWVRHYWTFKDAKKEFDRRTKEAIIEYYYPGDKRFHEYD